MLLTLLAHPVDYVRFGVLRIYSVSNYILLKMTYYLARLIKGIHLFVSIAVHQCTHILSMAIYVFVPCKFKKACLRTWSNIHAQVCPQVLTNRERFPLQNNTWSHAIYRVPCMAVYGTPADVLLIIIHQEEKKIY